MNGIRRFSQSLAVVLALALALSADFPAVAWGEGASAPEVGGRESRALASLDDAHQTVEGPAAEILPDDQVLARTMVASAGETPYPSLQAAVDAAQSGDTVMLLADVQITEPVIIPAGKDVVVDLGGHAVEGRVPAAADPDTIRGAFEVAGSALFDGGGKVANATDARNAAAILVQPGGRVLLADMEAASSGTAGSSGSAVYAYGHLAVGQTRISSDDVGIACNGDSTVIIGEDAFVTAKGNCIGTKAANAGRAAVTINGGTFATAIEGVSGGDYWDHGVVFWADKGSLVINGGSFSSSLPKAPGVYQKNGAVAIAGGTFEACDGLKVDATAGDTVSIKTVITGGAFEGTRSGLYFNGKNGTSFTIDVSGGTFAGGSEGALYTKDSSAVVSLTGGAFSNDVEGYCAPGYTTRARDDGSGWYEVAGNHEAAIGDARYATFGEALKAAGDGDTVRLLRDVETPYVFVYHSGVIDLAGHTLTGSSTYNVLYQGSTYTSSGLPLTIRNGSIECPNGHGLLVDKGEVVLEDLRVNVGSSSLQGGSTALSVQGGAHLAVAADCIVESRSAAEDKSAYALTVFDKGTLADIKGTLRADGLLSAAISGSGAYNGTSINVYPGAVVDGGENGFGIYHPQDGVLAVKGGLIEGATGIEIRAGSLDVSGDAIITGTMKPTEVTPNGNGGTTAGAGIAVAQHLTELPIDVKISGGTISGFSALYESNPQENPSGSISKVSLSVSGGEFRAINDGTLAVYSENKEDFVTGGTFDKVLDTKYYDEDVYQQNAQDAADAPGAVVPRPFAISYDLDGGSLADGTDNPGSYTFFDEAFTLSSPTRAGYTFAGWTGSGIDSVTMSVTIEKNSTGDRSYKATWTANKDTAYTVSHFFQNVEGDGYTQNGTDTMAGTTGEPTNAAPKAVTGFTAKPFDQVGISADGLAVVNIYYDRNMNDLVYKVTGSCFANEAYHVDKDVRYGTPLKPIDDNMVREGYMWSGWTELPATMPDNVVTVIGSYTAKEARIVFVPNGGSQVADLVGKTGEQVAGSLPAPSREGYAFAGWYADEALATAVSALPTTYPAGTTTYYAKWNAVPLPPDETGNVEIQVEVPAPPADGNPHATVTEEAVEAAAKHAASVLEAIEKDEAPVGMMAEDVQKVAELVSGADTADVRVIVSLGFEKKDENEVDDSEKDAIGGAASDGESVQLYLDLSVKMVVQVVKDGSVQAEHEAVLGEVEEPLLFEVHVDPNLIVGKSVRIAHVHGDETEIIVPESVDRDTGIVRFYAKSFSTYALLASGTVTVTFDSLGGSAVPAQTIDFGGKAARPDSPTRAGYTFGGWFVDEGCMQAFGFDTPVERPLTLFAKWTPVDPGPGPSPDPEPGTDPGIDHKPGDNGGSDLKHLDTPSKAAGTKRLVGTGDGTGAFAASLAGIAALAAASALAAALRRRRSR